MLEVVGVTGVVHLGQIQSGLKSAIRIIQVRFLVGVLNVIFKQYHCHAAKYLWTKNRGEKMFFCEFYPSIYHQNVALFNSKINVLIGNQCIFFREVTLKSRPIQKCLCK